MDEFSRERVSRPDAIIRPTSSEWVLWGFHPQHQRTPIKLTGGNARWVARERKFREGHGWICAVHRPGTEPAYLRLRAEMR